jgi:hypothetical protein
VFKLWVINIIINRLLYFELLIAFNSTL